jgi:hypothetical protein
MIRSDGAKRGRGRPPGVDTSGRLTIQMRPVTKTRLEWLGALQRRPLWQIVDTALQLYISTLPETERRAVENPGAIGPVATAATPRADPDKQWVSLAAFIGSGAFGGASVSRLSTGEIRLAAKKRGIDPGVYLDGTRAGRNRLELAIRHRSEVVAALQRGETVPDVALEAYPDLAAFKPRVGERSPLPRRFPGQTSDR